MPAHHAAVSRLPRVQGLLSDHARSPAGQDLPGPEEADYGTAFLLAPGCGRYQPWAARAAARLSRTVTVLGWSGPSARSRPRQGALEQRDRLGGPARLLVGVSELFREGVKCRGDQAQDPLVVGQVRSSSGIASAVKPASW